VAVCSSGNSDCSVRNRNVDNNCYITLTSAREIYIVVAIVIVVVAENVVLLVVAIVIVAVVVAAETIV